MWQNGKWKVNGRIVSGRFYYQWHSGWWFANLDSGKSLKVKGGDRPDFKRYKLIWSEFGGDTQLKEPYTVVDHFFVCDCRSHGLKITTWQWDKEYPEDDEVIIEIWKVLGVGEWRVLHRLWDKIKMCWDIMFRGQTYVDDIVLKHEDALRLAEVLAKLSRSQKTFGEEIVEGLQELKEDLESGNV